MIITSVDFIAGHEITQNLGMVRGSTVRARNVGRDLLSNFRNIVGGELKEYTKLQAESREQALQRMMIEGQSLQADAIIGIRITTSMIVGGAAEILVYGTAVKIAKKN